MLGRFHLVIVPMPIVTGLYLTYALARSKNSEKVVGIQTITSVYI